MFLFIGALRALPLVDAMTLVYVGPLIVTALAPAMLGEHVGRHRWAAVLVGFAGVILMLRPGGEGLHWAAAIPVAAAFLGALRDIITRRMSAADTSVGILFATSCIVALASAATLPLGWEVPSWRDLALIAVAGALRHRVAVPADRGPALRARLHRFPVPLRRADLGRAVGVPHVQRDPRRLGAGRRRPDRARRALPRPSRDPPPDPRARVGPCRLTWSRAGVRRGRQATVESPHPSLPAIPCFPSIFFFTSTRIGASIGVRRPRLDR